MAIVKEINDLRASQDIGSALFIKRDGETKYHLYLPVTDMPASGSAPATADSTVTTSRINTQTSARKTIEQKEYTFFAHRDNYLILEQDYHKQRSFLQVNPDGTGFAFTGEVDYYQDAISVNNNMQAKLVITVSSAEATPRMNVLDIIEDTVTFPSVIPAQVFVSKTGTEEINILLDPSDATASAVSDTTSVATASVSSNKLTITGVAAGSAIVTLTASKTGLASGTTTILVVVE